MQTCARAHTQTHTNRGERSEKAVFFPAPSIDPVTLTAPPDVGPVKLVNRSALKTCLKPIS